MGRRWLTLPLLMAFVTSGAALRPASLSGGQDTVNPEAKPFLDALTTLVGSPSGKGLLETVKKQWSLKDNYSLITLLSWGDSSRTDAVLTRHLDLDTGREEKKREIRIFLRRNQEPRDLILDLAHELTHASVGPQWDPYDPELTPARYIWIALEGKGGEVDAVVRECEVGFELFGTSNEEAPDRCLRYLGDSQAIREKVRKDFYRVGERYPALVSRLGNDVRKFPLLSNEPPLLFSSTGKAPYPFALYEEFVQLNASACENTMKRLESLEDRAPASLAVRKFLSRRCTS